MLKTDVLMSLCERGLFAAKWSERIEEEWVRNLNADFPKESANILRRRDEMRNSVPDWEISPDGIASIEPGLMIPDPKDRHVLAAAIVGHADCVVTDNVKDFGTETVAKYGIEIIDTDSFIVSQIDLDEYQSLVALKEMRMRWRNPQTTAEEFCAVFEKRQLLSTAQRLRERIELL
jgi:predicted nucleic acid-binding protein